MPDLPGYLKHAKPPKKMRAQKTRAAHVYPSEDQIQQALFAIIFQHETRFPVLKRIFHCPNGGARPASNRNGHRYSVEGQKMGRMGVRKGVPDILWPLPRGQYLGLAIELKSHHGRLSPEQIDWRDYLKAAGYRWELHRSADDAWQTIRQYLNTGQDN